ncbi:MAG: CoA-acylating methylmalonate-semialdehyde dehydrogenase [SAR324 cluster bacterium]|nr:CoA-acylating methylmalonate-semialdehyde dehydrogenase [SAR324 cluster bacterium]
MNEIINNTEVKNFIKGSLVRSTSLKREVQIYNPALGQVIRKAYVANSVDVDKAVAVAKEAFVSWSAVPITKRAKIFFRYLRLLEDDLDTFAKIVSEEHGKTLEDAHGSIARGLEVLEFCCGITTHLKSDYSHNVANGVDVYNLRQPLGVCAGITPFNFPAMVPMWMYPISIVSGNSFILKPSEKTPSAAIYQAEKLKQAGLPDGVFNVLIGDKETVDAILRHPDIEAISFVGSTKVGEYIYKTATAHNKRAQALCGAKNHLVVMPDADFDKAADALIGAGYGSAGERCMAISVVVAVGRDSGDEIVKRLVPKIKNIKVGAYNQSKIDMGPVIDKASFERINKLIQSGVDDKAKLVVDGRSLKVAGYEGGYFIGGCLFDQVSVDMQIYQQEIFGPVLCVVRVDSYQEAIKLINDHEYGNGVAIFTRDGGFARDFATQIQIGMVGINVPIPVPVSFHSFGGWKRSIFGSHSIYGMEGVNFYTRLKTVTSRWSTKGTKGVQFSFQKTTDL